MLARSASDHLHHAGGDRRRHRYLGDVLIHIIIADVVDIPHAGHEAIPAHHRGRHDDFAVRSIRDETARHIQRDRPHHGRRRWRVGIRHVAQHQYGTGQRREQAWRRPDKPAIPMTHHLNIINDRQANGWVLAHDEPLLQQMRDQQIVKGDAKLAVVSRLLNIQGDRTALWFARTNQVIAQPVRHVGGEDVPMVGGLHLLLKGYGIGGRNRHLGHARPQPKAEYCKRGIRNLHGFSLGFCVRLSAVPRKFSRLYHWRHPLTTRFPPARRPDLMNASRRR